MAAASGKTKKAPPTAMRTSSPELLAVARDLASLALARVRQDGSLRVRQREQLRRALARAADAMDWFLIPGTQSDRVTRATRDVAALAGDGVESLEGELADQVAGKKEEVAQLQEVARSVQEMAADAEASYPAQVEYSHTARHGSRQLITKIETLTLSDATEAQDAAAALERRMDGYAKLRDRMLEELKDQQSQVRDLKGTLPSFVDLSKGLVGEVLQTLY